MLGKNKFIHYIAKLLSGSGITGFLGYSGKLPEVKLYIYKYLFVFEAQKIWDLNEHEQSWTIFRNMHSL